MKKLLTVLLSLLVALCLFGCSSGDSGSGDTSTTESGEKKLKIAVMPAYVPEEWSQTIIKGAQAACDYYGYEMHVLDPDYDVTKQISCMEDAATGGYDALIMQSVNGAALIDKCKELVEGGLIIVDFDCLIAETGSVVSPATASVKANDVEGGATALDLLVEEIGEDATIFLVEETPGVDTGLFRNQGFTEAAAKYPNLKIIERRNTGDGDSRALNHDLLSDALLANPEITGYFAYYGDASLGAYEACEELDRKDVKIVGYDATADQIDHMQNDEDCNIIASIANNPGMLGGAAVELVHAVVEYGYTKRSEDDVFEIHNALVTLENASTYSDPIWSEPIYTEADFK